jgi:hypothetical protein
MHSDTPSTGSVYVTPAGVCPPTQSPPPGRNTHVHTQRRHHWTRTSLMISTSASFFRSSSSYCEATISVRRAVSFDRFFLNRLPAVTHTRTHTSALGAHVHARIGRERSTHCRWRQWSPGAHGQPAPSGQTTCPDDPASAQTDRQRDRETRRDARTCECLLTLAFARRSAVRGRTMHKTFE